MAPVGSPKRLCQAVAGSPSKAERPPERRSPGSRSEAVAADSPDQSISSMRSSEAYGEIRTSPRMSNVLAHGMVNERSSDSSGSARIGSSGSDRWRVARMTSSAPRSGPRAAARSTGIRKVSSGVTPATVTSANPTPVTPA